MLARLRKHAGADEGFTLVELLVVITILGILAGVVVFAVRGLGDNGKAASTQTEAQILRTAEEAYCAQNGQYGTLSDLRTSGLLTTNPAYTSVVKDSTQGTCGGTSFVVGSTTGYTGPTNGASFLGASNTTTPFQFLAQDFSNQNGPVQLTFLASSVLASRANTPGDADALFASADEANVNAVIDSTAAVAGGSAGTCTKGANGAAPVCLGDPATKTQYTNGRLVVFTCRANTPTLPSAANGSTSCKAPVNGYSATPPTDVAGILAQLAGNPKLQLVIATPGNVNAGAASTAPYGLAAYQALMNSGLTVDQYNAYIASKQIVLGGNVTQTQTTVESGAADFALIPRSFVVSPNGNDQNAWTTIAATLHQPIRQWAVVLKGAPADQQALASKFIAYLLSGKGQAVLASYGYDTIS